MMRTKSGFTLMEVLLAVVILAFIMIFTCGIVASTIQAQERIEEITTSSEVGPGILSLIRQDLEGASLYSTQDECFAAYDRKSSTGDRDRIDFICSTMAYGSEREGEEPAFNSINEVGYLILDSPTDPTVGILYRREDFGVDSDPLKGGRLIELYDRVRHFNLQFWDGEKWLQDWSSKRNEAGLPKAVRIELKIVVRERDDQEAEKLYVTTVTFPR